MLYLSFYACAAEPTSFIFWMISVTIIAAHDFPIFYANIARKSIFRFDFDIIIFAISFFITSMRANCLLFWMDFYPRQLEKSVMSSYKMSRLCVTHLLFIVRFDNFKV